ncbi:MAG: hypothetical protein ACJAU1_001372 [Psychromonas sp.]|jgi:hypothetical protein
MSDFIEKINLRGKAEEDIYFAKLNQKLIDALHKKMAKKSDKEIDQGNESLSEQDPENLSK